MILRMMLSKENKKRDMEPTEDSYDDVWLKHVDDDGSVIERKVDRVCTAFFIKTR